RRRERRRRPTSAVRPQKCGGEREPAVPAIPTRWGSVNPTWQSVTSWLAVRRRSVANLSRFPAFARRMIETSPRSRIMPAVFRTTRRVEFADTDMAGIVHFANFFRYMESAEHEFLRSHGLSV